MSKIIRVSREQVAEFCPDCAELMAAQKIKELKLTVLDLDVEHSDYELRAYGEKDLEVRGFSKKGGGFSQGLCDKFGGDEGFFTRCHASMSKHLASIDDANRFCASLKHWCTGHWPAEKGHEQIEMLAANSNAVRGVEIFATGTHNGDEYTEKDLDDMIEAFKKLDYRPAIKVGHTKDKPGAPSYGWVTNLRKIGTKLVADFESMHDTVLEALRNRSYDRVSSEIYFNLKRGGNVFRRALKAVALLGSEIPAVANLVPLHKMEFDEQGFDSVAHASEAQLAISDNEFVDALARRVDGLIKLMKELDMAKNADKIKQLKADLEAFKAKMKDKKDKGDGDTDDYKQLVAQADLLAGKITALEAEDAAEDSNHVAIEQMRGQLATAEAAAKKSADETKQLAERLARIENDRRNTEIGDRVRACKVPVFRSGLNALYAFALSHAAETVKVFTEKDGKVVEEQKSLAECVDGLVKEINAQAEKLFKVLSTTGAAKSGKFDDASASLDNEDAQAEVARRISEYRAKHPEVKQYEQAARAVLDADPDLKARYSSQLNRAQ